MKAKILIYYLISFFLSCLVIISANILFMRNRIYKQEDVYSYHPTELMEVVESSIQLSQDGALSISESAKNLLSNNNSGFQLIDSSNREVYSYHKPAGTSASYTGSSLLDLYASDKFTTFLDDIELKGETYTYLIFLDSTSVKRMVYSYDVGLIQDAHSFTALVTINLLLLFLISFIYTLKITGPLGLVLSKIVDLSRGSYEKSENRAGIYGNVITHLNELGFKLAQGQRERDHLEQMRNEWISNISHDIKTPLTSIIGNAEIIGDSRYDLTDDMKEKYCNRILNQSSYIKTLVDDLNLSTKLNSPYFNLNMESKNIVSLMRHTIIDLLNGDSFSDEQILFHSSDEEIVIDIDSSLMERAFINLISNAFIHNSSTVNVNIYIEKRDAMVSILIEDDGIGVSLNDLDSIFTRYYRGTDTSKGSEGSGLGLAITHDIIKLHGGNITAENGVFSGLKVEITLPAKAH